MGDNEDFININLFTLTNFKYKTKKSNKR